MSFEPAPIDQGRSFDTLRLEAPEEGCKSAKFCLQLSVLFCVVDNR